MGISVKSGLKIETFNYKKISIIEFKGSLVERNFAPIKNDLLDKFSNFEEYVAFDMAKVPFISIDSIKELVFLNKQLKALGKESFLIKLHRPVRNFLEKTAVNDIFRIRENAEQVFQEYLLDKGLVEEDIELNVPGNKLNKWYNKMQEILSDLKDNPDLMMTMGTEENDEFSIICISQNIAIGRSITEAAKNYNINVILVKEDDIRKAIGKAQNLIGYVIDGFETLESIKRVVDKIRFSESDFCKSLIPILVTLKIKLFDAKTIMKLNELVYYMVDDTTERDSKIVRKSRYLYENLDKVLIYLSLNFKFELTTEICTFYFLDKMTEEDAELLDAFVSDDFINDEIFKEMFTINFNYYKLYTADELFFTTIQNIVEKYDYCIHFITKKSNEVNDALHELPVEMNFNEL